MTSDRKTKIIIIVFGILFAFIPIFINNPRFITRDRDIPSNYNDEFDQDILKISAVSGKIHIDGNSGWAAFKAAGNCTGSGNYTHPYVIENLVIDGVESGSCIWIENSNVYFKIENCSLYNSGYQNSGIQLINVTRGTLLLNNCTNNYRGIHLDSSDNNTISGNTANENSGRGIGLVYCRNNTISGNTASNNFFGIYLDSSDNNTISGNTVNENSGRGIYLEKCNNNTISENTANYNDYGIHLEMCNNNTISENTANYNVYGIYLYYLCNNNTISGNTASNNFYGIYLYYLCNNNTISGNIMNECGLRLYGSFEGQKIDITNLVNGKPLYYYTNEINLGPTNFTNAGQVVLFDCNKSQISNLNILGISLHYCYNNNISVNTASHNNGYGIYLDSSDNNTILGNIANNNNLGIRLDWCNNNTISGNTANENSDSGIYLY